MSLSRFSLSRQEFELTKLRRDELRDLLCNTFGISMDEEDFRVVFLKVSYTRVMRQTFFCEFETSFPFIDGKCRHRAKCFQ